jgi:hypothetical protein
MPAIRGSLVAGLVLARPAIMTKMMFATMVLVTLVASRSWAQDDSAATEGVAPCAALGEVVQMPGTIQVADDLRQPIELMLRKSSSFRAQCRRIAKVAQLYVRVRVDARLESKPFRARTTISRLTSGTILADIDIQAFGDPTEWLAHEFEHLVEQIEGLELNDLVRRRRGAWYSTDGMFETDRAIRMGRTVLEEVRGDARGAVQVTATRTDRAGGGGH